MEGNRGSKVIALVALVIGIVGISLGFAAFSNTLNIGSSATVTPDSSTFDVNLSKSAGTTSSGTLVETTNYTLSGGATLTSGHTPTITNDSNGTATLSDIHVTFTAPGQSATFTVYARNDGEYTAYLNSIKFFAASGATNNETKVCAKTQESTATDGLVTAACAKISYSITVGSETITTPATGSASGTDASFTGTHTLASDANETIALTISYDSTGNVRADGPFDVTFGDIVFKYSSAQ